jgi:hypothetical protein
MQVPVAPVKMPKLDDLPDIGAEVARKTQEAKTARIACSKASARLVQHKQTIDKAVGELKEETEKKTQRLNSCRASTTSIKKQLDAETAAALAVPAGNAAATAQHEKAIRALEERLAKENKECAAQDYDEKKAEKSISDKNAEVKEIVRFIKETCADAASVESDVEDAITMVAQIEYTNRVYVQYIEYMQKLEEQEKIFEANEEIYEKTRKTNTAKIIAHQRKEEEHKNNALLLRAKLLKIQTESATPTPATGTTPATAAPVDSAAVKEQITTLQNALTGQEKVWKEEERSREHVEAQQHIMQGKYEVIIAQTNNVRSHTERMK